MSVVNGLMLLADFLSPQRQNVIVGMCGSGKSVKIFNEMEYEREKENIRNLAFEVLLEIKDLECRLGREVVDRFFKDILKFLAMGKDYEGEQRTIVADYLRKLALGLKEQGLE